MAKRDSVLTQHDYAPFWRGMWEACRKCGALKPTKAEDVKPCPESNARTDLSKNWPQPEPLPCVEPVCGLAFTENG